MWWMGLITYQHYRDDVVQGLKWDLTLRTSLWREQITKSSQIQQLRLSTVWNSTGYLYYDRKLDPIPRSEFGILNNPHHQTCQPICNGWEQLAKRHHCCIQHAGHLPNANQLAPQVPKHHSSAVTGSEARTIVMTFAQQGSVIRTDGIIHDGITCYKCQSMGHYSTQCPNGAQTTFGPICFPRTVHQPH